MTVVADISLKLRCIYVALAIHTIALIPRTDRYVPNLKSPLCRFIARARITLCHLSVVEID
jgi:hypothetical protein